VTRVLTTAQASLPCQNLPSTVSGQILQLDAADA